MFSLTINKNSKFIKISNVRATDNKLEVKLDFSKEVGKYFFKNHFEVYYDKNIGNVDESILSIPAVCVVIHIAWATGADLYVDKLDETFLLCLKKIRKAFEKNFPKFSSSGDIHVKEPIVNKFNNKQSALFFSCGLDSLASYKRNKDQNPILITILSVNKSNHLVEFNNDLKNLIQKFAKQEGREIHFIRSSLTNFTRNDIINDRLLCRDFKIINWWQDVAHGFIRLGLFAPLAVHRIGRVLVASTYSKNFQGFDGFHFLADNDFSWADIGAVYDGDLTRQEKIQYLKSSPNYLTNLIVCFTPIQRPYLKNCGFCSKCLRTITGLILEGIDPNECNFDIKNNVLDEIKDLMNGCKFLFKYRHLFPDIQNYIPDTLEDNQACRKYHAKEFFEWFRDYQFPGDDYSEGIGFINKLKLIYYCLKYNGINFTVNKIKISAMEKISRMKL